jgi:hypothetical protein
MGYANKGQYKYVIFNYLFCVFGILFIICYRLITSLPVPARSSPEPDLTSTWYT